MSRLERGARIFPISVHLGAVTSPRTTTRGHTRPGPAVGWEIVRKNGDDRTPQNTKMKFNVKFNVNFN